VDQTHGDDGRASTNLTPVRAVGRIHFAVMCAIQKHERFEPGKAALRVQRSAATATRVLQPFGLVKVQDRDLVAMDVVLPDDLPDRMSAPDADWALIRIGVLPN